MLPSTGTYPYADGTELERRRAWNCLTATARMVRCSDGYSSERHYAHPTVLVILEAVCGPMEVAQDGGSTSAGAGQAPHISIIPAGSSVSLKGPQVRMFRELAVEITRDPFLADRDSGQDSDPGVLAATMIVDPDVLRIAELMFAEFLSCQTVDPVFAESLSVVLLKMLSRLAFAQHKATSRGGLAPWQLRQITQFLEDNLVDGARLDDMAQLVDLSTSYLIRAFKRSTGLTPQQWLRAARIRRAQKYLLEPTVSLASVAQETGFADQAHLTRTFGQITGESPGAWRRARLTGPAELSAPLRQRA